MARAWKFLRRAARFESIATCSRAENWRRKWASRPRKLRKSSACSAVSYQSRASESSKFPESIDRMRSFQNGFSDEIFSFHHSFRFCDNFLDDRLRNYEHAITITDNVVTGLDMNAADIDGNIVSDEAPATDDVHGRLVAGENRKTEFQNVISVARASINHGAASATKLRGFAR